MIEGTALVAALALAAPLTASAEEPAGAHVLKVSLHEILWEREAGRVAMVLRFVAPRLGEKPAVPFETIEHTADGLCARLALPIAKLMAKAAEDGVAKAREFRIAPERVNEVIVTLMARPIPRGMRDPSVRQHIFAYDISAGRCEWLP